MQHDMQFSFRAGNWMDGTPYRVVKPIGAGGMGEVYEVDHTRAGTRRAVKVTRHFEPNSIEPRRLLREARTLQTIDHPNVVRVFEVGALSDGRPYFSMELLQGMSLRSIIADQAPMDFDRATTLILQVLDGLAAIHARGFVHRDVKPSNVFVSERGVAKVIDLGIVKPMSPFASGPRTREGMVVGTTRYMAPEQLVGGRVDSRTDVYSVGLVLLELLVGKKVADTAWRDGTQVALPRDLPPRLKSAVRSALARDPNQRFRNAEDMAAALRSWFPLRGEIHRPERRVVPGRSVPRWSSRTSSCCTESMANHGRETHREAQHEEMAHHVNAHHTAARHASAHLEASHHLPNVVSSFKLGALSFVLVLSSIVAGIAWKKVNDVPLESSHGASERVESTASYLPPAILGLTTAAR